jgi:diacylglycerol kinase (ATP)
MPTATHESPTAQKQRRGLARLLHATRYSIAGLRAGWREPAFKQEALLTLVLLPAAFWLGATWVETALLLAVWTAVLVVELLNTAVEAAIDRIGPEWHDLSKKAKDMGSAAVLLALTLAVAVWTLALWHRIQQP